MSKTELPVYLDGNFNAFKIEESDDLTPKKYLVDEKTIIWFEELSVFDTLRFDLKVKGIDVSMKIRITQYKGITAMNVLKIDDEFHEVVNVAHFTNKDGFKQSDLTLKKYKESIVIKGE